MDGVLGVHARHFHIRRDVSVLTSQGAFSGAVNKGPKVRDVTFGATPLNKSFRAQNLPLHCAANDWAEAELQKVSFLSSPSFSCIFPSVSSFVTFTFQKKAL